jgi:diguanylate cyclase (GGDEF)-like protein/PAS domain S-box-containing protein
VADGGALVVAFGGGERRPRATRPSRADGPRKSRPAAGTGHAGLQDRRLLLDHISDAVFASDAANRITQWTPSAERLFGYTASEAIGRWFGELLPYRMEGPEGEREFLTALEAGRTWRGTGTVRLRDGREMWLGSVVEPIMAGGRFAGSVSVSRDITPVHEAQQKLADSERFISAILDVVGALVVVFDSQARMVRFNAACERLSGYRSDEVVGLRIWDMMVAPAEIAEVHAVVADLQAGVYPKSHESHWMTRSGSPRLISWVSTCLTDERGVVTHVIATGIDITERRKTEEKLAYELQLMQGLMENLPAYVYFKDRESRFIRISNSEARALGLSDPAQAIGKTDFDFFTDEHARQAYEDEQEIIRTGQVRTIEEKETRTGLPDTWVETTKLPLRDKDGAIVGTFGISVDVTDRRNAEGARRDRTRLFTALAEFAAAVNSIREPERLVTALVDAVGAVVPSDTVVITTLDRSDGRYRVSAVRGLAPGAIGAIIEPGIGTSGRAIAERSTVVAHSHPRAQSTPSLRDYMPRGSTRSVGVPLIHEDTVLGVIAVGRTDAMPTFTEAEREVFALLGLHAALALANAYLAAEVEALAIHDGLTGLYNRRHFDAALDLAIARVERHGPAANLAAIMFDLDHFGDFNRDHGHLAGDAALRLFGEILRNRSRAADVVARYGGEEFVAILEDCGLPEAARRAEEIRVELEGRTVPGADGRLLTVTVSAGCAVLDPTDPTKEALVGAADARLFAAKRAGRNQVVAGDGVSLHVAEALP